MKDSSQKVIVHEETRALFSEMNMGRVTQILEIIGRMK